MKFSSLEGFKSHERMVVVHSLGLSEDDIRDGKARIRLSDDKESNILSLYLCGFDDESMDMFGLLAVDVDAFMACLSAKALLRTIS